VSKPSIGLKVKAAARFKPEVPAKPMPNVVNTSGISGIARELHFVLNQLSNAEVEFEGRF